MNTKENSQKSAGFVSKMKVVPRTPEYRRTGAKVSRIIQADHMYMEAEPVMIGDNRQTIQIVPIMGNGRIKAIKASCSCGSESIYDIQYTEPERTSQ